LPEKKPDRCILVVQEEIVPADEDLPELRVTTVSPARVVKTRAGLSHEHGLP
jgi:hypothetical protein